MGVYVAEFATKSLDRTLMRVTAIVRCVGGSMVWHSRRMQSSIQAISDESREKIM